MQPTLPTAEQFFSLPPQNGQGANDIWSSIYDSGARILNAVGFGVENNWGARPIGLQPDEEAQLRKSGFFNDYANGRDSFFGTFNEAVIRPAAQFADLIGHGPGALLSGVQSGFEQAAREVEPQAGPLNIAQQAVAGTLHLAGGVAGALASGTFGPEFAGLPLPARFANAAAAARESDALRARALGVVGEGEAGFYDAVPPSPEAAQARAAAAFQAGVEPEPTLPPPIDIHDLARRIDPETFQTYDALGAEMGLWRARIQTLANDRANLPEAVEAQGQIDTILGRVNGVESRLTNAARGRLEAAQARLDDIMNRDTPEMAEARNGLLDADFARRELAVPVSAAYRDAADLLPAPEVAAEAQEAPRAAEGAEGAPEAGGAPARAPGAAAPVPEGEPPRVLAPVAAAETEANPELAPAKVVGDETLGQPKPPTARYGNLRAVQGTGETTERGLAEGVEAKAIEDGLTQGFGDLPEYQRLSMADQARQAAELIGKDYETAKAIAMGDRQPPKGLLPESVFVGVEKHALQTGDVDTLQQLATRSRLVTAATTMGQRIRTLAERDQASPVGALQEIQSARETAFAGDLEQAKATEVQAMQDAMRGAVTKKPDAWENFLAGIRCEG